MKTILSPVQVRFTLGSYSLWVQKGLVSWSSSLEESNMRKCLSAVLSLAVVFGLARVATADEKIPLDKVPAKVLEAAKAKFPKATLVSASKEDEDGKIQYELVFKEGEKKFDGIFSPDGKLVALEEVIKEEEVPAAAKEGFKKKYGTDVKLTGYEKITKG